MGMPCTVCAHRDRADIDRRLAFQVVNVKQLALSYGLKRDAVARHRAKHLPSFLPAMQARADALTLDQLNAEAQRLYLVALDALARAESGTLSHVADDGTAVYAISSTAVARLLREARSALDMLAKLALVGPATPPVDDQPALDAADGHDAELDRRIAAALDRAMARAGGVEDAVIVADADGGDLQAPGDLVRASAPAPRAYEVPLDAVPPLELMGPQDAEVRKVTWEVRRAQIVADAAKRGIRISPASTPEEIHAYGYIIDDDFTPDDEASTPGEKASHTDEPTP